MIFITYMTYVIQDEIYVQQSDKLQNLAFVVRHLPLGGIVLEQNKNSAFSGASWIRFLIT